METSPLPLLKAMLPKVPLMGKTALSHTFGFSEHSKHWDLRTELTISVLRSFLVDSPPEPISKIQKFSLRDPGVKGRMWVSRIAMPIPAENDIQQALYKAIEGLKEEGEAKGGFTEPEMKSVEAEWTGYRAGATKQSTEVKISEEERYKEMMKEVTSPTTVLYFHGGAYYLMDPSSHRPTCKKLAKLTKGRVLSVRYRLAPQNPFPAQLLDALISYFTLLYPPRGSFHTPVEAKHIVFGGDSAGGNLCLVLLQTLLEFRRQGLKIKWNGEEREVQLPAGISLCSPWADITHSSPSCEANSTYDYLPSLTKPPPVPKCQAWPSNPPRKNLYAEDGVLCHPLVSPIAAKSWEGACPMYVGTGQELLTDEDRYVASKAASQGVTVIYEEYEAMPHCFAMLLETLPGSRQFFTSWAKFISAAVENPAELKTKGTKIEARTLKEEALDVSKISEFTAEEVRQRMRESVDNMTGRVPDSLAKL